MLDTDFGSIKQLVRFANGANGRGRKVLSLQCDDVDTTRPRRESFCEHERGNVL